jgi:hypothetical protein
VPGEAGAGGDVRVVGDGDCAGTDR